MLNSCCLLLLTSLHQYVHFEALQVLSKLTTMSYSLTWRSSAFLSLSLSSWSLSFCHHKWLVHKSLDDLSDSPSKFKRFSTLPRYTQSLHNPVWQSSFIKLSSQQVVNLISSWWLRGKASHWRWRASMRKVMFAWERQTQTFLGRQWRSRIFGGLNLPKASWHPSAAPKFWLSSYLFSPSSLNTTALDLPRSFKLHILQIAEPLSWGSEDKSIVLADFNKESESKLFFCCLENFPPNFQPYLKTLVMDISESVSDGQHFPALYFFCKVYIFPLFSLKSSRTIISTDS